MTDEQEARIVTLLTGIRTLLIQAMEDFSENEPNSAIVVFSGANGVQIMATANVNPAEIIGLLEVAKAGVIRGACGVNE